MAYFHSDGKLSYPISQLGSTTIDYNTLIELIIDEYGDGTYVSKNATIEMFGDYLVSSHAIFNLLNDMFNDRTIYKTDSNGNKIYRYISDLYIPSTTYFLDNPYLIDDNRQINKRIEELSDTQTITKRQLQRYIQEHGFQIDTMKGGYDLFIWNYSSQSWRMITTKPQITESSIVQFSIETEDLIPLNSLVKSGYSFYHGNPNPIVTEKNTIVTIIGSVALPNGWNDSSTKYYIPEYNRWVALLDRKPNNPSQANIFGITELHNITSNGQTMAYFSITLPLSIGTKFSIVMPFTPETSNANPSIGSIYSGLNKTNHAIVYYWGENLYINNEDKDIYPDVP